MSLVQKSSQRSSLSNLGAADYMRTFIVSATFLTDEEMKNLKEMREYAQKEINIREKNRRQKLRQTAQKEPQTMPQNDTDEIIEDNLTEREQDVLDALIKGLSYKETAAELIISETTVKTHINNIFSKKQVNSHSQLLVKEFTKKQEQLQKQLQKQENPTMQTITEPIEESASAKIVKTQFPMLSPREKEVAELILDGRNNHQISAIADISLANVSVIIVQIYKKTHKLVNYQTKKGKRAEFIDYCFSAIEPKSFVTKAIEAGLPMVKVEQPIKAPAETIATENNDIADSLIYAIEANAKLPQVDFCKGELSPDLLAPKPQDNSWTFLLKTASKYEKEYEDCCFAIGEDFIKGKTIDEERQDDAKKVYQKWQLTLEILEEAGANA